jgi:hypothetical protein
MRATGGGAAIGGGHDQADCIARMTDQQRLKTLTTRCQRRGRAMQCMRCRRRRRCRCRPRAPGAWCCRASSWTRRCGRDIAGSPADEAAPASTDRRQRARRGLLRPPKYHTAPKATADKLQAATLHTQVAPHAIQYIWRHAMELQCMATLQGACSGLICLLPRAPLTLLERLARLLVAALHPVLPGAGLAAVPAGQQDWCAWFVSWALEAGAWLVKSKPIASRSPCLACMQLDLHTSD